MGKTLTMNEYDIKLALGHILVDSGCGWLLVDTGSPLSFHESGRIILCGESFSVPTSLLNADADYVSGKVHERVSGLVGMDIVSRFGARFDLPAGKLTFGCGTDGLTRTASRSGMGYVFMDMTIGGRLARVILDSGAPISYIDPSFTEGLAPVDEVTDFNPMVPGDTFRTPLFELPVSFAGKSFSMRAGHLPSSLGMPLSLLGVDGIVGLDILSRFPLTLAGGGVWV